MINNKQNFMSFTRLFLTSAIISLSKFDEIINHYGKEIKDFPEELRNSIKNIKNQIEERGVYKFRSQYLAHAFSTKDGQKKPLTFDENVKALMKIVDYGLNPIEENFFKFAEWIYKKDDEESVVNVNFRVVQHIDSIVGGLGKRS